MEAVKHRLIRAFWLTLAVIFLIESWLWDHVKIWLRAFGVAIGVERYEARLRDFIGGLPPYGALAVFVLPAVVVLPLEFMAFETVADGHALFGLIFILTAKTLALGVTAYLFDLCREKLMQLPWFVQFYDLVLRARAWANALVEPARQELRTMTSAVYERAMAIVGEGQSQFMKRVAHIRALATRRTNSA